MTQKPNRSAMPDDNSNPFSTFINRIPPATIAFLALILVVGVMLLLSTGIDSTSSTRTMIVTDTPVATAAATVIVPTAQSKAATVVATAAATVAK